MTVQEYNSLHEYDKAVLLAQKSQLIKEEEDEQFGYGHYLVDGIRVHVIIDKYNPLNIVYKAVNE